MYWCNKISFFFINLILFLIITPQSFAQVNANFDVDDDSGCSPLTVNFSPQTVDSSLNYRWNFGNGNISTEMFPSAIYYVPGDYTVTLLVTDANGIRSENVQNAAVKVFKDPVANFDVNVKRGCRPLTVNFENKSTLGDAPIEKFTWDFGDGNLSNSGNPTHEYHGFGGMNIHLNIIDKNGCVSSVSKPNFVQVDRTPIIKINTNEYMSCTAPFTFKLESISDLVGPNDVYEWTFSDGKTASGKSIAYTATKEGFIDVTLTITTPNGCKRTKTFDKYLYVGRYNVDFDISRKSICIGETVEFTNKTEPLFGRFKWDLGDGRIINGLDLAVSYNTLGTFIPKLVVEGNINCIDSISKPSVRVNPRPDIELDVKDYDPCPLPFTLFVENLSHPSHSFSWIDNDVLVDNPNRTFRKYIDEYGEYHLTLILESINGCKNDTTLKFNVYPPRIKLTADIYEGCVPLDVNFTFETDSNITFKEFVWDFGDSSAPLTLTSQDDKSHNYSDTGRFLASITGYGPNGCLVTDTVEIRVGMKTDPDFLVADSFCNDDMLKILNLTPLDTPYLEYLTWVVFPTGATHEDVLGLDKIQDTTCSIANGRPRDYDFNYGEKLDRDEGYYSVLLQTVHNGCKDTIIKDSVFFVSYPWTIIDVIGNNCDSTVTLINNSVGYHGFEWTIFDRNGSWTSTDDTLKFSKKDGVVVVKLETWNDSTGCRHVKTETINWLGSFDATVDWDFELCGMGSVEPIVNVYPTQRYVGTMYINESPSGLSRQSLGGPGEKNISVELTNSDGCRLRFDTTVMVLGANLDGLVVQDSGCTPIPVQLTANYNPNEFRDVHWLLDARKVNLQDSGTINDTLFSAVQMPRDIMIQLIGVDTMGCEIIRNFNSQAIGPGGLKINVRRYNECERKRFNFEAYIPNVDLTPYEIKWDFGNGTQGDDIAHVINYAEEGEYIVKLEVTEPNGCRTKLEYSINLAQEKIIPDFDFKMSTNKCPPVFVEFNNTTLALNRNIRKVLWDFGDGSFSEVYNPKKIFTTAGEFNIKLYVEDMFGCKDSIVKKGQINIEGPHANAEINNIKGCVPLTATFTAKLKNVVNWEWDFGDGIVIENQEAVSHTYKRAGIFIPLLIIQDSTNCKVILPLDTVKTQDPPQPYFQQIGICLNQPVTLVAENLNTETEYSELLWLLQDAGNTNLSYSDSVVHTFNTRNPMITLSMTSSFGCVGEIQKGISLSRIDADFTSADQFTCIGGMLNLANNSSSDTRIEDFYWVINGEVFLDKNPVYLLSKLGPVPITLIQKNAWGCIDSFFSEAIIVGDTVQPPVPDILRVTVLDDYSVQLDIKESQQEDFKSYWIYREIDSTYIKVGELVNIQSTSFINHNLNPLEYSYCFKIAEENGCGLVSDTVNAGSHCTIETKAHGELNRNRVNWSEYYGFDEVEKYRVHRRTMDPNDKFEYLATVDGFTTEYIDSHVVCETIYSYLIEGVEHQGNLQVSFSDTAVAIPIWDYTPPPNKLVRATVENNKDILVEWDSVKNSQTEIVSYTLEKSFDGINYRHVETFPVTKFDYLDKEVEVMERSYFYRIFATDECDARTPFLNYGKTILLVADSVGFQRPRLNWSTYQGWTEDVDYYTIEIEEPNIGFVEIGSTASIDSTFIDELTALNQRPNYCYRIIGHKIIVPNEPKVVSVSNVDCSPVYSAITYPNAFSPNADGINDTYGTPSFYIKDYHIQIFNRWGELVFESFDIHDKWDGLYMGKPAQQDAYAVIIHSIGVDLIKRTHFGTITLVR